MSRHTALPLWFKIAYTVLVAVIVAFYTFGHGLANFLWFSNVALLSTVLTAWLELRLLATMQLIGVGVLEVLWTIDLLLALSLGGDAPINLAGYMFDTDIPLVLRILSLYHLLLPWMLLWLTWRLGFDDRGWWAQALLAWSILLTCFFFTDPDDNINWTFGFGREPQDVVPPGVYLIFVMVAYPLVIYLPSHFLFKWLLRRLNQPRRHAT